MKHALSDVWVIARRGVIHMRRQPEALADATFQPIMFVLLFAYVFGGAIAVPGEGDYKEFLMGGIFAQTIIFVAFGVAMGLAADRSNGAIDRFRSLPMARGAVLGGHALANMIKTVLPIVLMSICGLIIGWKPNGPLLDTLAGFGLMFLFAFAMIWVGILLGSILATPEAVQGVGFTVLFPLTFIASTFVPTPTLPGVLRTFAEWNPVSSLAGSLRTLFDNPGAITPPDAAWPVEHPILYTVLWAGAIVLICAPLAVSRFHASITD
jgi:ABC-2 type transport system permease protein